MSDMMLTQQEAERMILNHYGQAKQEIQAVQELSELTLLLAARRFLLTATCLSISSRLRTSQRRDTRLSRMRRHLEILQPA